MIEKLKHILKISLPMIILFVINLVPYFKKVVHFQLKMKQSLKQESFPIIDQAFNNELKNVEEIANYTQYKNDIINYIYEKISSQYNIEGPFAKFAIEFYKIDGWVSFSTAIFSSIIYTISPFTGIALTLSHLGSFYLNKDQMETFHNNSTNIDYEIHKPMTTSEALYKYSFCLMLIGARELFHSSNNLPPK